MKDDNIDSVESIKDTKTSGLASPELQTEKAVRYEKPPLDHITIDVTDGESAPDVTTATPSSVAGDHGEEEYNNNNKMSSNTIGLRDFIAVMILLALWAFHSDLNNKIDELKKEMREVKIVMNQKIDNLEQSSFMRFDQLERKVGAVLFTTAVLFKKTDRLEQDVGKLKGDVDEIDRKVDALTISTVALHNTTDRLEISQEIINRVYTMLDGQKTLESMLDLLSKNLEDNFMQTSKDINNINEKLMDLWNDKGDSQGSHENARRCAVRLAYPSGGGGAGGLVRIQEKAYIATNFHVACAHKDVKFTIFDMAGNSFSVASSEKWLCSDDKNHADVALLPVVGENGDSKIDLSHYCEIDGTLLQGQGEAVVGYAFHGNSWYFSSGTVRYKLHDKEFLFYADSQNTKGFSGSLLFYKGKVAGLTTGAHFFSDQGHIVTKKSTCERVFDDTFIKTECSVIQFKCTFSRENEECVDFTPELCFIRRRGEHFRNCLHSALIEQLFVATNPLTIVTGAGALEELVINATGFVTFTPALKTGTDDSSMIFLIE